MSLIYIQRQRTTCDDVPSFSRDLKSTSLVQQTIQMKLYYTKMYDKNICSE